MISRYITLTGIKKITCSATLWFCVSVVMLMNIEMIEMTEEKTIDDDALENAPATEKKRPIRGESPYELLLAYAVGLTQKDMISKGYPMRTVYDYAKRYELAKKRFQDKWGDVKIKVSD